MKQYKIFGGNIEYSSSEVLFHSLRIEYKQVSEEYGENFLRHYDKFMNIENVVKNSMPVANQYLLEIAKKSIDILISYDIYSVDEQSFINNYIRIDNLMEAYNKVCSNYEAIIKDTKELEMYREYRKSFRGKFVGGGFGVEGAVKGIATAGALNLATGMIHGTFNALGNISSKIADSIVKNKLYNNPNTRNLLADALKKDIQDIYQALIVVINQETSLNLKPTFSDNDEQRKSGLLSNLKRLDDTNQKKKIFKDLLKLDPIDIEIYHMMIDSYGDQYNEIKEFGEHFGVSILDYKLEETISFIDDYEIEDENDLIGFKEKSVAEARIYGLEGEDYNNIVKLIDNRIDTFLRNDFNYVIQKETENLLEDGEKDEKVIIQQLIDEISPDVKKFSYVYSTNDKRFQNAIDKVSEGLDEGEYPIFLFDDSIMGNGKGGILITNCFLRYKNVYVKTSKIPLNDIGKISGSNDDLIINDHNKIMMTNVKKDSLQELVNLTMKVVSIVIKKYGMKSEESYQYDFVKKFVYQIKDVKLREQIMIQGEDNKKYENALTEYVELSNNEKILLLFDITNWSTGKKGFVITNKSVQINTGKIKEKINLEQFHCFQKGGSYSFPTLEVINLNGNKVEISWSNSDSEPVEKLSNSLNKIIRSLQDMKTKNIQKKVIEIKEIEVSENEKYNKENISNISNESQIRDEYKTKEEAELLKKEKNELAALFIGFDSMKESQLLELQPKVNSFTTMIADEYRQKIIKKLEIVDIQKRTVDEIIHDTLQEAEKAKVEQSKLNLKGCEIETFDKTKLIETIRKIEDGEFSTNLSKSYYDIAKKTLGEINSDRYAKVKKALRHQKRINYGYSKTIISIPFNITSSMCLVALIIRKSPISISTIIFIAVVIGWHVYIMDLIACAISWNKFKNIPRFRESFVKEKIRNHKLLISIGILIISIIVAFEFS